MKILVDMNLSPQWVRRLSSEGWEARHWSEIGDPRAPDQALMQWARDNDFVILTHDLDFGTLLALTHGTGPSVIQMRSQDVTPDALGETLVRALRQLEQTLSDGALVVVDKERLRVRVLPIR